ncbi:radical SAM protein [Clostridium sp. LIBA-8841]|uniref:SPL family radical SAM protein n=1 Tax=Clostridium sp. LIBA-8841 TaxID=2987530 RepID=UPI002AC41AB1|nr:radical SAM protein [Clostridium sp. LIBA-8841]MDZ5253588.1 radical SAM protein [Clostridium sp. LIBA-8841]
MREFRPVRVYYEPGIIAYAQGRELLQRYRALGVPIIEIESHHRINELRFQPHSEFNKLKKYLVLGTRKTLKLTENDKSADFIVPFTSSGCAASCLYCYLVCNFGVTSYLRVFVNRDEIMNEVKKNIRKIGKMATYELGCNSDLVLENTITGNLRWAIEEFGKLENAKATFATKFHMINDLLDAKHNGNTQMRISVNPEEIIRKVEIGTSSLEERIAAANKMYKAGYRIGLNIAPVILVEGWENLYRKMFKTLGEKLNEGLKDQIFIEVIFMTYGISNDMINRASMLHAVDIFHRTKMKPKGRGKYQYKSEEREPAEKLILELIKEYFPKGTLSYMV